MIIHISIYLSIYIYMYICIVGKAVLNHPPNHHFYRWYGYVWLPFPVMGGLWHCFTHIVTYNHHTYIYTYIYMYINMYIDI